MAALCRDFGRYGPLSAQERCRTASIAARASATASPSSASSADASKPLAMAASSSGCGIGDGKGADRAGRALQRMRQRAGIRRHGSERAARVLPIGPRISSTPPARSRHRRASCAGGARNRSARRREPAVAMASILSVRGEATWLRSGSPQHSDSTEGHFPPANHGNG